LDKDLPSSRAGYVSCKRRGKPIVWIKPDPTASL
jgi:hypothetical protein